MLYSENDWRNYSRTSELSHHGIQGMKWGVRNGPPYPLDDKAKLDAVKRLSDSLNSEWEYGVLYNGKHISEDEMNDDFEWDKNYRTIPVDTLKKEKIGTCWDFVNYQHDVLKNMGIKDKAYMIFIQRSEDPRDAVTHTFTTFELGDKNYWLESAAWPKRGLHEITDWKDVAKELNDMYKNTEFGYSIFEYNPDGMDKGLTTDEFVDKATQNYIYDEPGKYTKEKK